MRFEVHVCGDPASDHLALCLHGFPEHAFSWRFQLPLLARLGMQAWAPNQRGYGATTRPRGVGAYRMERLLEDVAALVDASGCRRLTLLGHDWGGAVAWFFAMRAVRPLERLVVMNLPHPLLMRRALRSNRAQRRRSRYALFFQLPWLPEALLRRRGAKAIGDAFRRMAVDPDRFPDEVLAVYRENALRPGALTAMLNWYRAARRLRDEDFEPAQVHVPTLVVWGEQDAALGVELLEGTDALVDDLTVRRLPEVSHWVQQEAPEKVNAILEAWLRGEEPPRYDVAPGPG
ncbi:MAG: alpha/beta hydrolase [Myxococcota bacterium]|nr:alpha/beta hydrolase [Myxococcota bacterium]